MENEGRIAQTAVIVQRWRAPVMSFLAILVLLSALYVHDRGLDITDESYYVLSASQPENIAAYISPQHWITAPLWSISGDLATFRLIGLLLLLLSSALLSGGVVVVARSARPSAPVAHSAIFACSLMGAVLYLTTINLSPSYNLMASVGCYSAIGLSLMAGRQRQPAIAGFLCLLAGLMLAVEFASKPSAGISTFLLLAVLLWAAAQHLGKAFCLWVAAGLGFVTSLLWLALAQGPWPETQAALRAGYGLFRVVQSEPIPARLLRYAGEYFSYLLQTVVLFLPMLAAMGYFLFRPTIRTAFLWLSVMLGTLLLGGHYLGGTDDGAPQDLVRQIGPLLLMLLISVGLSWKAVLQNRHLALLIAGLFTAPYSVAIGTGNALFTQVIDTLAPWGALIAFLPSLDGKVTHRLLSSAIAVIFAVTVTSQIVSSLFRDAYHLNAPLVAQTELTDAGEFGQVRLDAATAAFVAEVKSAAVRCRIPTGSTYLGLYDNPGLAVILRANTVTSPWINNLEQGEILLPRERFSKMKEIVVARKVDGNGAWPALPGALGDLEEKFNLCGTATYPFKSQKMEIWYKGG